jgi:phage baseplate assembly protein gpV
VSDSSDVLVRAFAPQSAQNREQRVYGLVTARVEKIEDDGSCRLKLFGMNGGDDDDESAPARVMMPMAGKGRGVHFLPEPGDEVVVGFHAGDTNHPIILGSVWNGASTPPEQAKRSASNHVRTIVTRSGHELTFDDTPGAEKVTVKSQGGHRFVLDDSPLGPKVTLSTMLGKTVTLDDRLPGSLTVVTPTCQVIMAEPGVVTINAATSISLNAPAITLSALAIALNGPVV